MKCLICKQGETRPRRATVPLQRNGTTIIFKGVPADVCENCGEYYLSEEITGRLLERAEQTVRKRRRGRNRPLRRIGKPS